MPEPIDPYLVLQVDPEAEAEVIKAAYRRLAREHHPDLAGDTAAEARMAAINAAWELIGEPGARAAFDRSRATGQMAAAAEADGGRPGEPIRPGGRPARPAEGRSPTPPPETVSRDWTSGRSTVGGGFDDSMRAAQGLGAEGPPPGRPSGSVLNFGRFSGWSLGEIARQDLEYLEWLDRMPIGRGYRDEIDGLLRAAGRRRSAETADSARRGLFRRR